ncbi:hypothetical protein HGM15179_013626 [Zosterops borbonicus]|uniref:Uncharacterized protein n=1 Tax=Zosterops borbonicus TaxID=364589 RepID=A0A8K1LH57_9PASS|nr:hypothetical protein HGM15179_013626 [Zosterops borbonicus]
MVPWGPLCHTNPVMMDLEFQQDVDEVSCQACQGHHGEELDMMILENPKSAYSVTLHYNFTSNVWILDIKKAIIKRKEKGHHIILSEQSGANEFGKMKILQDAELENLLNCLPLCSLQRYLSACF